MKKVSKINNYNYAAWYKLFAALIKDELQATMIELNGNGKTPPKPFVAFDVISPYIPINYPETNAFEAAVSFTIYGKTKLEALTLASQLRYCMLAQATADKLAAAGLILVEVQPTQIRSTIETNEIATMVGFDVTLRITDTRHEDETAGQIDKVTFDFKGGKF